MALRVSERARRIVHVPDILYHWRLLPNSTATSVAAKPLLGEAERMNLDIGPMGGEELQELVAKLYAMPPRIIERAKQSLIYKGPAR